MYDISFIIPICDLTKNYYRRFLDLRKYVLTNVGDYKVRVKLLTGPDEDFYGHDVTKDWPQSMTAEEVKTPYMNPAQKISHYYATLTEEEVMTARWHAKFDDDTATDIAATCAILDEEYEYQENTYFVTELRHELHGVEQKILTEMGFEKWNTFGRVTHEWEGCINSQGSLMKMIRNDKAMEYLKRRTAYAEGFGDQPVGIAMKFCKVPAIMPGFMTVWAKPSQFSMWDGPYTHIHFFLGRQDMNYRAYDFYKILLDKNEPKGMKDKVSNRMYVFTKKGTWDNMKISLREDNRIMSPQGDFKGMWIVEKKDTVSLVFHDMGHLVLEVQPTDDTLKNFSGTCYENKAPLAMRSVSAI